MLSKPQEKKRAIKLRQKGLSYSEILKLVPVSQATLSLWLRNIRLDEEAKKRLLRIQHEGIMRGANRKKDVRILLEKSIKESAAKDVGKLSHQALLLMGAALYWAEGSKQKIHNVSTGMIFSNSDERMLKFFYRWLTKICEIDISDIYFELYIHRNAAGDINSHRQYWAVILGVKFDDLYRVRYKSGNIESFRKNKLVNYHGLIRIRVRNSTNLNRKIMGWALSAQEQFTNNSGIG